MGPHKETSDNWMLPVSHLLHLRALRFQDVVLLCRRADTFRTSASLLPNSALDPSLVFLY